MPRTQKASGVQTQRAQHAALRAQHGEAPQGKEGGQAGEEAAEEEGEGAATDARVHQLAKFQVGRKDQQHFLCIITAFHVRLFLVTGMMQLL